MKNRNSVSVLMCMLVVLMMSMPGKALASVMQGDVNHDGCVNISDVTSLIDYLLIGDASEEVDLALADINGDGAVTIADVTSVIDYLLSDNWSTDERVLVTVNGVTFVMVPVQGGTFTMGATVDEGMYARRNEYPAHKVTLWGYYISESEVTQEQWLAVTNDSTWDYQGDLQRPMVNVSLFDCAKFVDQLTALSGKIFRMPTEAEWEFAARGGSEGVRYRFSGSDYADEVAWYSDNSGGSTHPVKTKMPNSLGIYDMSGNVLEWCQDWYSSYNETPETNPVGPESGLTNVVRGGAWDFSYSLCHVTCRNNFDPYTRADDLGFRIVMNMDRR
ncbi:MAG: SUMF1/EgtB/PvdO family nonheme iron enzyme [Muribaculaceae bacterium]|nr:SUMF1/EgtB/PvdO family nonheme iron enzyme [Muribaculaceae bacterium]